MTSLILPGKSGLERYELRSPHTLSNVRMPARSRRAYAAAHVVIDPLRTSDPVQAPEVDWEATLAYRHHLWDLGLGVAEAMDTAQRGMGLPTGLVRQLIERSSHAAAQRGAAICCGANTDSLDPAAPTTLRGIEDAYLEQCSWIEGSGGQTVIMASRALCRTASSADDYLSVYGRVLQELDRPAILHWLGDMFDPQLTGYWGSADLDVAADTVLELIRANSAKVDGIKVSLLDAQREIDLRLRLPHGVRMFTGDDFNYPELVRGDGEHHSDALLGIFDAIAPLAAEALAHLDADDMATYERVLAPTVPLSRAIFEQPTYHYKTGIVFLSYLRGFQSHFTMLAGAQSTRSIEHLARVFKLADGAGLFTDPDLAAARMRPVLATSGVEQGGTS